MPTYQRQSIEEKKGEDCHEASQNDNLDRFYNKRQEKSHNEDETSVQQTPGEPNVETECYFGISCSIGKDLQWSLTNIVHSCIHSFIQQISSV